MVAIIPLPLRCMVVSTGQDCKEVARCDSL